MSEFDNNNVGGFPYIPARNPFQNAAKVCAQCKHFYTLINNADVQAMDARHYDEIRLCYEIHWCSAASPVCDDDFEPVAADKDSLERRPVHHYYENECKFDYIPESKPKPQKEIQYVYIGLLQENPNAVHKQDRLVEVPTEIDGVATNYRRVEMGPMDWDLSFTNNNGMNFSRDCVLCDPNTATSASSVVFPKPQTDWGCVDHFGLYDSFGSLIDAGKLNECGVNIKAGVLVVFPSGLLNIPISTLTKGGE